MWSTGEEESMKTDPDQNEVLVSRIIEVLSRYSNRWLSVRSICIQIGREYGEEPTARSVLLILEALAADGYVAMRQEKGNSRNLNWFNFLHHRAPDGNGEKRSNQLVR
ncbi:hypothetical protein DMB44_05415 [Thermoplasma sp. Kam2015]|uniref:hypothetical protein n=1 Tax=Thermoplasma sp. Kam2015 TaxID=2094122 RepID=UPI000D91E4FF|nr:hypothetical protein [Thermoplasma sp. Kam2015]PYB68160.1 hypothetical protein DMB44_05415 [Thermoplasma sp. Kam2015]